MTAQKTDARMKYTTADAYLLGWEHGAGSLHDEKVRWSIPALAEAYTAGFSLGTEHRIKAEATAVAYERVHYGAE